ncbi:MAG: carboxyl-terminal processing [Geobacteraceae bacterium]|nr:MAG: carboxyl-terminal processing [Geobacteraceae bacterium]
MGGKARKTILLVIITALLAAGFSIGIKFWKATPEKTEQGYIRLFTKVIELIKQNYVEKVDDKKLMQSAINGMLAALDPHSSYLPPDSFTEMKVEMSGSFGGLGIEISIKDNKLTVISPIEDTPAFRAGIKSGDHIWKIDDKFTRDMSITKAVSLMRGPKGTRVTLAILREGHTKPLVFPLVRDIIQTKSLKFRTLEGGFGYIRIAQFQERTGDECVKALQSLRGQNGGSLKGLVLDLRNNPGGLLDQAIKVADRFIGEGFSNGLIVYTEGRDATAKRSLSANVGEKEPPYPIVVLINGGSASASEILAGALQDHKRAVIMGTQSFGKGSIQSIMPLRNGGGLKLTTARYYTPNGRSIQAKGITPDIVVAKVDLPNGGKKEDQHFREKDLENHIASAGRKDEVDKVKEQPRAGKSDEEVAKDYQLSRALELLRGVEILSRINSVK